MSYVDKDKIMFLRDAVEEEDSSACHEMLRVFAIFVFFLSPCCTLRKRQKTEFLTEMSEDRIFNSHETLRNDDIFAIFVFCLSACCTLRKRVRERHRGRETATEGEYERE